MFIIAVAAAASAALLYMVQHASRMQERQPVVVRTDERDPR